MNNLISLEQVEEASAAIAPLILRTPCIRAEELSKKFKCPVYLKLENLQVTGAFKIRGNAYKLSKMPDSELSSGVVTASSGNHGLGLSLSASRRGVSAKIFVPSPTPRNKIQKLRALGADVVISGNTYNEAVFEAEKLAEDEGRIYIPSFDDADIITGNATMGLEIYRDVPDISLVVVPVGGGGAVSGIGLALKKLSPSVRIIGAEAQGAASMASSLEAGERKSLEKISTIADGIAVAEPGRLTFKLARELAEEVVAVSDEEIKEAIRFLASSAGTVAEPAGAAAAAALGKIKELPQRGAVVCLVSGGNIDRELLSAVLSGK